MDLQRFVAAQDPVYEAVRRELGAGCKTSHWMWFVFPQAAGLGMSAMSRRYALGSLEEARAYLSHPVLGERLRECVRLMLGQRGKSALEILGSPDDLKFRSSMTLFAAAAPGEPLFARALERFFGGRWDDRTLGLLGPSGAPAGCLLPACAARRMPWRNGRGSTLELARDAAAPNGEWTWRLSLADLPERAQFSRFPGVDRLIACLDGTGLDLERDGTRAEVPREGAALAFAGEEAVVGIPLGAGVRDANLMTRRERWRGRLWVVRARPLAVEAALVVVHAPETGRPVRVAAPQGDAEIPPGRTWLGSGRVEVAAADAGVVAALDPRAAWAEGPAPRPA